MLSAKKIINNESELQTVLSTIPKPLVFTNGCFDILHRGHTTYLEQARNLGAALIVGVNSDQSVRRQGKGHNRPLNTLADRAAVLASLECVDAVIDFDSDTPAELIRKIRPNILAKGGDWPVEKIIGADFVYSYGGDVFSIAFEFDRSTTSLIEKIRAS